MKINKYECKMCGEYCRKVPCEIVPDDLAPLLKKYNMSFRDFFLKYLIAIPCTSGEKADIILRLSPVKKVNGHRSHCFLKDEEYMDTTDKNGECIFLKDSKCEVHDVKPLGGRIMKCAKMTGGLTFQLTSSQYFIYWYNNQNIFWELSEGVKEILTEAEKNYEKANECYRNYSSEKGSKKDVESYRYYKDLGDSLMTVSLKEELNKIDLESLYK